MLKLERTQAEKERFKFINVCLYRFYFVKILESNKMSH